MIIKGVADKTIVDFAFNDLCYLILDESTVKCYNVATEVVGDVGSRVTTSEITFETLSVTIDESALIADLIADGFLDSETFISTIAEFMAQYPENAGLWVDKTAPYITLT